MFFTSIVWHKEDLKSALESKGFPGTEKNIEICINNHFEKTLKERSVAEGWTILDDLIGSVESQLGKTEPKTFCSLWTYKASPNESPMTQVRFSVYEDWLEDILRLRFPDVPDLSTFSCEYTYDQTKLIFEIAKENTGESGLTILKEDEGE
ncbi:hypothetical protein [Bacillus atrophaeus]|uniref:hypothetical protein n=1 Tax=Bacillus atrophaeus TaxID=1452 RepID=UPI00077B09A4|nr:hypothetical protein [Bacillus atrophaeus]KXZ13279.1 hypothetical protein AXI57_16115 [Bacillus atrophaeus]MED4806311.1 hypothetical protein [Bacillus atrophaeus]UFD97657.1 hypothetical protein [Bacillus atrophaeus]GED04462.1 hypothetical protein BAT02nite_41060 [Bacillus atrophaeus]